MFIICEEWEIIDQNVNKHRNGLDDVLIPIRIFEYNS